MPDDDFLRKRKRDGDSDDDASLAPRPKAPRPNSDDPDDAHADNADLPQPYNAKALQPATKRALSPSDRPTSSSPSSQPRRQKRPGARARITDSQREAARLRQAERERQADIVAADLAARESRLRGTADVVREHYNNVPERGRDWRRTDSRIKGLRSFNNWIKSCVIQRFAPDEDHHSHHDAPDGVRRLLVLDMGCGKGGDLGKWQRAPQPVDLYVGVDPADVSIEQARGRYRTMLRGGGGGRDGGRDGRLDYHRRPPPRLFDAHFFVKDCFGEPIEQLEIVRQVGFDPSPTTMSRDGFDVVSIMFAMNYAFETEQKARMMLRNVAGALKKGGRLIGCIPNSDVIGARVRAFHQRNNDNAQNTTATTATTTTKENPSDGNNDNDNNDNNDPDTEEGQVIDDEPKTAEWGNPIYCVRFPGATPPDGIFRPAFGWRYSFFLDEAVDAVPEYVVPWEAFRALAEDYNLELRYRGDFLDVWRHERDDPVLGPLSERMGVRARGGGRGELLMTEDEKEAAAFYTAFCFYKV